jgi:hypothetical protein
MTDLTEHELPEFLSDPMSVLFDLNDDLLEGMDRIRYALGFAFWAGGLIAIGSVVVMLWYLFIDPPEGALWWVAVLALIALVSAYASYSARAERPLLEDYWVLGWGVHRANTWDPNPKIPEGKDALSRLIAHLREADERIGYFADEVPEEIRRDASVKGRSKQMHGFDMYLEGDKPAGIVSDPIPEGMVLMVRKVERATLDDVKALAAAAEDVLKRVYPTDQAARVILLQTGQGVFSEDVVEFANKNWMKYKRSMGDSTWDWSSPVELIGEDAAGRYTLKSVYFG